MPWFHRHRWEQEGRFINLQRCPDCRERRVNPDYYRQRAYALRHGLA